jgi:hypothetical protein
MNNFQNEKLLQKTREEMEELSTEPVTMEDRLEAAAAATSLQDEELAASPLSLPYTLG